MKPEEQRFLDGILENPTNTALRLIYADWLEEQGDPRAEFLRVQVQRNECTDKSERRALKHRLQKLRKNIVDDWLAVVDSVAVEGCFHKQVQRRVRKLVRFEYECSKRWEQLQSTEDPFARFCDECQKNVFFCESIDQAQRHANRGHCIAIDSTIARTQGDVRTSYLRDPERFRTAAIMGRPTPPLPRYHLNDKVRVQTQKDTTMEGTITRLSLSHLQATVKLTDGETVEVDFEQLDTLNGRPQDLW
ncbi:MAG: TIGR02996 domain-containing protein [Gemmataceae bacterium]